MNRERVLQVVLVIVGLLCVAGIYPLTGALAAGVASAISRQDQMILSIYIVLGVFLLLAARKPQEHRSLILFTGWSTVAHDSVMIVQGLQRHDLRGDLISFSVIMLVALALLALTPSRQLQQSSRSVSSGG